MKILGEQVANQHARQAFCNGSGTAVTLSGRKQVHSGDRPECTSERKARERRRSETEPGAVQLSERDKCLVKIFLAFESYPKLKGFPKIDSLAHADTMPNLRLHLSSNHISVVALDL
jgi:hypothetical protein